MARGSARRMRSAALVSLAMLVATGLAGCGTTTHWVPAAHATAATTSSPRAAATAAATTFTLSAVGDTIVASAPNYLPPNGGAGFFDDVSSALHSDLQMANLEEPITDVKSSPKCSAAELNKTCFAFRAPTSYAKVLKEGGFDLVNLANNHTLDYGTAGHTQTKQALTAAGIQYTGPPGEIPIVTVKGIKVAVIGFAPYSWANNLLNIRADQALIAKAKTMAAVVIVQAHMGGEGNSYQHVKPGSQIFLGENRGDAIAFSHAMIDAGADIVIGHSPHVLRAMEFYKGHLIAYSLGNFAGYHALATKGVEGVSMVLRVTLTGDGSFVSAKIVPTSMVAPGVPKLDPAKKAIPLVTSLTHSDFPKTGALISTSGAITAPSP
jgi:poly-gamma-glutamate capsule biosynthesis protein CapA/YwtB (metallophosphatase superfamily)